MVFRRIIGYKFSVLIALLIFYLSVRPTVPDVFYLSENNKIIYQTKTEVFSVLSLRDYAGHLIAYCLLSLALLVESIRMGVKKEFLLYVAIGLPIVFGGVMEFVQEFFFPPRAAEWSDWFFDCVGIGLAYLLYVYCRENIGVRFKNLLLNKEE